MVTSNYTYADRAGNIVNLWNAALPLLPHPSGGDAATPVSEMGEMWARYIPFEALPLFRNPPGGYVHNENDSPHFANGRGPVNTANAYPNMEPPMLHLRSQHAIALIDNNRKMSLEDVVRLKHSYRMLLADRVKPDLVTAVRGATPTGDVAAEAFVWAVEETARRHGRWDVAWGDVHRVRRGAVDVPVGGCSGQMGCFRVLTFARDADGKLSADGWVLAVEFGAVPRAYSVLGYGESPEPASPWHADQAAMFARGELKRVAFTARDVDAQAVARYRPGER